MVTTESFAKLTNTLAVLDVHYVLGDLTRYVAEGPDSMPSSRLYEGDLDVVMNLIEKCMGGFKTLT